MIINNGIIGTPEMNTKENLNKICFSIDFNIHFKIIVLTNISLH